MGKCKGRKTELNNFYCIQCGEKGICIQRPMNRKKEKFHRKKLYCPHCKVTINHIECRNDEEVYEFKEMFENGEFKDEIEESLKESAEIEF